MKIRSNALLTPEQSRSARLELGLSQAAVLKQSGLQAHKLKSFEVGRSLQDRVFLQELRAFYERGGVVFEERPATGSDHASVSNDAVMRVLESLDACLAEVLEKLEKMAEEQQEEDGATNSDEPQQRDVWNDDIFGLDLDKD